MFGLFIALLDHAIQCEKKPLENIYLNALGGGFGGKIPFVVSFLTKKMNRQTVTVAVTVTASVTVTVAMCGWISMQPK